MDASSDGLRCDHQPLAVAELGVGAKTQQIRRNDATLSQYELNELADRIGRSNLTIRLHTAAPSRMRSPTNVVAPSAGGGSFGTGATLAATNITTASSGDIENSAAISFGTATADVGTVTHWSAYRGTDPVAFGTLPSTVIARRRLVLDQRELVLPSTVPRRN